MDPRREGSTATAHTAANDEQAASSFPRRYSSHGAVPSQFPPFGGETWVDFLRQSGDPSPTSLSAATAAAPHTGTRISTPSSSTSSASRGTLPSRPLPRTDARSSDRKRRLTTADAPLRRRSGVRMYPSGAGSSGSDPIVLDSSPATPSRMLAPLPPLPPLVRQAPPGAGLARRQSDIVLPRWQPDGDVTQCPVCGRHFTFLFRKHHCRKCGRVVCSACSPHRITIPRQFIVQPPSDNASNIIDLTGDDETTMSSFGPFGNPALGGGEEVRVCNPCVPDPNYSPPPQYDPAASSQSPAHATDPARYGFALQQARQQQSLPRAHAHGQTHRPHGAVSNVNDNRRVSYHGTPHSAERWLPPLPDQASRPHHTDSSGSRSSSEQQHVTRPIFTPFPSLPQQAQPHRRHQVAEEDECPICGEELPPKGNGNDETERIQHVEECIALHSASPAPGLLAQQTSTSLPNPRARGMSNPDRGNGEGSSNYNRMSHAARGMFPYIATEKDCTDDEGREAECIICLEDFEAGDKMARLVCWCKFHEKCIKEWWDKKGRGACPTHQLQK